MSVRVQIILGEEEAAKFRAQARKESMSFSAWLRLAGNRMLEASQREEPLTDPSNLLAFFQKCKEMEDGTEPDWEAHERLILEGYRAGGGS